MLVELKHHQSAVDKELQNKKTRVLERQQRYHRERFQGEKSQVLHRVQLHQAQLVEVQKLYQLAMLL
jgi:Mg2+ and Co2+ transporter CorA